MNAAKRIFSQGLQHASLHNQNFHRLTHRVFPGKERQRMRRTPLVFRFPADNVRW